MADSLRAGFVPFVDAAPLIAAAEQGFAAERGVKLRLFKQAPSTPYATAPADL